MTVKEVAKYLKLSEMMVYKLAQRGEIPASKIGSAWRFSETEIDRWMIREARSSQQDLQLPKPIRAVIEDFATTLKNNFGGDFLSLIIFGSYARGEADSDSDLDLLIVLKKIPNYWKVNSKIHELAYATTFGKGKSVVMAPIIMSETEFLTGMSPILLNIRIEGRKAA